MLREDRGLGPRPIEATELYLAVERSRESLHNTTDEQSDCSWEYRQIPSEHVVCS